MVEESAKQRRGRQQDAAPFGIRAIESGIEVEGVWISKNNSPASSAPASPKLGPNLKGKGKATTEVIPTLQFPDQSHTDSSYPQVRSQPYRHEKSLSSNGSIGSFERATSAERLEAVSAGSELIPTPRHGYKPRQPSALRFSTADQLEAGNIASQYKTLHQHDPLRNGSESSQGSSEGSSSGSAQRYSSSNNHQQLNQSTYYQPSGTQSGEERGSRLSHSTLGHASPIRSVRTSYAGRGYTYGAVESQQPPAPQRFHHSSQSQTSFQEPFRRSLVDPRPSHTSNLETIAISDGSSMSASGPPPSGKVKRISKKLQKKFPSAGS